MSFSPSSPRQEQLLQELLLRMDAAASLLKFIEIVAPDTVPARHHRLLLERLEAVERGDIPPIDDLHAAGERESAGP
jgi:hypothetical protein